MHIREDRRHIQVDDVHRYREKMKTRLNLETSMSLEMIQLAQEIAPESVCLVPENRKEVTTEGGLDVRGNIERASEVVRELLQSGIPVSMFIDPDPDQLNACAEIGAPWVELHTGSFARSWYDQEKREVELSILREGMRIGSELGLRVNAGHGINYENVNGARTLELIHEFNIGHSIISRSIRTGLEESVQKMRALLNE
jgi:pyridoxine 5-phosphate synthase